jgi:hypothetical protein
MCRDDCRIPADDFGLNGTPGGDFVYRINVPPGDVNRDGAVLAIDFSAVKGRFFYNTTAPTLYSIFLDADGSGSILADDYSEVKRRFFQRLPPAWRGRTSTGDRPTVVRMRPVPQRRQGQLLRRAWRRAL